MTAQPRPKKAAMPKRGRAPKGFDAAFAPKNWEATAQKAEDKGKAAKSARLQDEWHLKVMEVLDSKKNISEAIREEARAFLIDWRDNQPRGYYEGSYEPPGLVRAAVLASLIREGMREDRLKKEADELTW